MKNLNQALNIIYISLEKCCLMYNNSQLNGKWYDKECLIGMLKTM